MTFEEYCNENNIDYDKIIDVLDNTDKEIVYKCSDYYRIEYLFFKTTNNNMNNYEKDDYHICININNFKVEIIREVTDDHGIHLYTTNINKIFGSFKSALLAYKEEITNAKPYHPIYKKLKCEYIDDYNATLELIDKLLEIVDKDKSANNFNDCIQFIEDDLTNVLLKNNIRIRNDNDRTNALFYADDKLIKVIIRNNSGNKCSFGLSSSSEYDINFDKIQLSWSLIDEDLTIDKKFSTLQELKNIIQKIVVLMEGNPKYENLSRDLQGLL